ncbi:MAG: prepilin peptidase [Desulfobacteraceae bacterium]|nr:MAG: prepilin peptidase [Desulfobacteraceae bacterium]
MDTLPPGLILTFAFIFGACTGSFLNVCIYRIPAGMSIVTPGSSCPKCNTAIPFYLNIPLLSYLILLGRCRYCRVRIPFRYFIVELITGLLATAVFLKFGPNLETVFWFAFSSVLLVVTFIDIDHGIIPDVISIPGILVFSSAVFIVPDMTLMSVAVGILAGGGSLYLVALGYYLIKKQEGMGGGDIKLLAMIGAAVGYQGVIVTIFLGSVIGTLLGIAVMIRTRSSDMKLKIPFGPFLAAGALIHMFWGEQLIAWYLYGSMV